MILVDLFSSNFLSKHSMFAGLLELKLHHWNQGGLCFLVVHLSIADILNGYIS